MTGKRLIVNLVTWQYQCPAIGLFCGHFLCWFSRFQQFHMVDIQGLTLSTLSCSAHNQWTFYGGLNDNYIHSDSLIASSMVWSLAVRGKLKGEQSDGFTNSVGANFVDSWLGGPDIRNSYSHSMETMLLIIIKRRGLNPPLFAVFREEALICLLAIKFPAPNKLGNCDPTPFRRPGACCPFESRPNGKGRVQAKHPVRKVTPFKTVFVGNRMTCFCHHQQKGFE